MSERWMTQEEVAEYLSISKRKVQMMTDAGEIPHAKLGRLVRYPAGLLEEVLTARAQASVKPITPAPEPVRRKRRTVQPEAGGS